jgi:hypothetical protein
MSMGNIIGGYTDKNYLDNPFQRFNISLEQYPSFLEDIDDIGFLEYDNFERMKTFDPKSFAGETPAIPTEDNDTKFQFYDVQGESLYTNPPDPNSPTIDHGLEEEQIWAFNVTGYNQVVIKNQYSRNLWEATKQTHVPFWGQKLLTPAFYKDEKYEKFLRQWKLRLGLESIKMRHSIIGDRATP